MMWDLVATFALLVGAAWCLRLIYERKLAHLDTQTLVQCSGCREYADQGTMTFMGQRVLCEKCCPHRDVVSA